MSTRQRLRGVLTRPVGTWRHRGVHLQCERKGMSVTREIEPRRYLSPEPLLRETRPSIKLEE